MQTIKQNHTCSVCGTKSSSAVIFQGEEHTMEGLLFDNQDLTAEVARLRESITRLSTEATEYRELVANFRKALTALLSK